MNLVDKNKISMANIFRMADLKKKSHKVVTLSGICESVFKITYVLTVYFLMHVA